MDIEEPHATLLGDEEREGLTDHFLYGLSAARIIHPSPTDPELKLIVPGTFSPRAASVYTDPRWLELLGRAAAEGGQVILLGPPLDRYPDLAALEAVDRVLVFAGESVDPEVLDAALERLEARLPSRARLGLIWPDSPAPAEAAAPAEDAAVMSPTQPEVPTELPAELEETTAPEPEASEPEAAAIPGAGRGSPHAAAGGGRNPAGPG